MIKYISEKQAPDWDMDISFDELINYNTDCVINRDWRRTKHDNCYDGCCIYLKHPSSNEYNAMIGLNDDGFTYIGDGSFNDGPVIPIEDGILELIMNRDYLKLIRENGKILK